MSFIDKNELIVNLHKKRKIQLELGCGNRKKDPDSIGIDLLDYDCVDIVGDVCDVLKVFPAESVDSIDAYSFIEHLSDISLLVTEMERVLKPNGRIVLQAPHFSNPHYYSDYTHRSFFGLYTLSYFSSNQPFKRKVPNYKRTNQLRLVSVDLLFKSSPPFYFRHFLKKVIQLIANSCVYAKEFYEENLCFILPCYEIRYELIKDLSGSDRKSQEENGKNA